MLDSPFPVAVQGPRAQNAILTRDQLRELGVGRAALRWRLSTGQWQEVLPGVYATFNGPTDNAHRLQAAVLYGGPGAMITAAAACRISGLKYVPADDRITVLIPDTSRRSDAAFVRVARSRRLPELARRAIPGPTGPAWARPSISAAPVFRAVLDLARELGTEMNRELPRRPNGEPYLVTRSAQVFYVQALNNVRAVLCESVQRGLATISELQGELDEGPRRGSGLARRALADADAGCRSAPECELRDLVRTSSVLPEPLWNAPLPGLRHVIPDGCLAAARLLLEVESIEWHRFGDAPERTEQRRALLASHGWTVYPVSPRRLRADPQVVLQEIEEAYLAGLAVGATRRPHR